jgi:hypothetical protein
VAVVDCARAQAVKPQPVMADAKFNRKPVQVADKVALGQVSVAVLRSSRVTAIPLLLHKNSLIHYRRYITLADPSGRAGVGLRPIACWDCWF